ncbi:hypothetical protein CVT24_000127 [Panaeolus cyanescens]|uniref:rRNA methyltransferase 2, mitochondrial n=1 Tax=Panaeolus cyanescens TaxID=181874 RepID=A0A409W7J2_9AGAR|nr:hypothetical protein CVT24_000127 [Panaeolus cyanescens]
MQAFRQTAIRLTQRSKSKSSTAWVARQNRDPYVKKRLADPASYRSRAAFKLLEMEEDPRYGGFLSQEDVRAVVDLGAAPGGWSQVVAGKLGWKDIVPTIPYLNAKNGSEEGSQKVGIGVEDEDEPTWSDAVSSSSESLLDHSLKGKKWKRQRKPKKPVEEELTHFDPLNIDDPSPSTQTGRGTIIAVDLLNISPITGVQTVRGDFLQESTTELLHGLLCSDPLNKRGKVDVVLSDMAANLSGNDARDTEMSLEICLAVFEFARWHLRSADEIGRKKGGVLL